jgi:hypothetical protein
VLIIVAMTNLKVSGQPLSVIASFAKQSSDTDADWIASSQELDRLELPMMLPGIKVNTSPTDHVPIEQMQFMRFTGKQWERFRKLQAGNQGVCEGR